MLETLIRKLREGGARFVTMEQAVAAYCTKFPKGRSERGN